jgi:hypothetical protein
MIDAYFKQEQLLQAGHDEFWLATKSESFISRLWYEEFGEPNMIDTIKRFGEDEGDCGHRIWLSDLNNMCNINGHTDIMSAVACKNTAGEDCVSIQVNTPDDKSTIFVSIYDFNYEVADVIYEQIAKHKK